MRYLYAAMCGLLAHLAHGQGIADTLQLPAAAEQVVAAERWVSSQVDSAGACTEFLRWRDASGLVRVFYASGQLKEYTPYSDLAAGRIHGLVTTWYASGRLGSRQPYLQGLREGTLLLYYENGQLKRQTEYVAGAELPGSCFDPAGAAVPYFPYEQLPLYPGGHAQLTKEITKALWRVRSIGLVPFWESRQVDVRFWVGEDGRIVSPQIAISSQVPALDQAVLAAIVKLTKRFHPGSRDGVTMRYTYHLPVFFSSDGFRGKLPKP